MKKSRDCLVSYGSIININSLKNIGEMRMHDLVYRLCKPSLLSPPLPLQTNTHYTKSKIHTPHPPTHSMQTIHAWFATSTSPSCPSSITSSSSSSSSSSSLLSSESEESSSSGSVSDNSTDSPTEAK